MSFFAVTIEEISEVRNHTNADRLSVATLKGLGFQFIIGKDTWQVGQKCLYFPLDSVLPDHLLKALNVEGKLAGAKKNRIKTIKLRGEISQGLIGPLSLIDGLPEEQRSPEEITKFLEVSKYEPEIDLPIFQDANLVDLPNGVGIYDIENCERFPQAVSDLMTQEVAITEKVEGSHFALAYVDGKVWVCQRRFAIQVLPEKPKHFFWEVAEQQQLFQFFEELISKLKARHLVLRGEILGPNIQKNIYRMNERKVLFFELMLEHRYIDSERFFGLFEECGRAHLLVPIIARKVVLKDWLAGKPLQEAANGESALYKVAREGIVIRPHKEQTHQEVDGRLILKQISPEYLAGAG